MSTDPLQQEYPDFSPYNFCENNPVIYIDPDKKEKIIAFNENNKNDKNTVEDTKKYIDNGAIHKFFCTWFF